ncbi:MAG TPA: 2'-5' RNA ligase family protein [Phycisphaerae bacterium]|nr:2'-5' RNA ligase family protein [Phycisphaerae bacterium]
MTTKTHQTAVVLIPPGDVWGPVQAIRREHDRQVRRWMPHVTLLYPFRVREQFDEVEAVLREAGRRVEPFEVRLGEFRHFGHGRSKYTLWLAPEPQDAMVRLQAALQSAVPDCDDASRHANGFTPHLSVGQVRGAEAMAELESQLQAAWSERGGLSFVAREVSLIWRGAPPDDVFRVDRAIPLGG